jgi:hypothetical protein
MGIGVFDSTGWFFMFTAKYSFDLRIADRGIGIGIWNLGIGNWDLGFRNSDFEFGIWNGELEFGIGIWNYLSGDGTVAKDTRLGRVVYPRTVGLRYLSVLQVCAANFLDLMQLNRRG